MPPALALAPKTEINHGRPKLFAIVLNAIREHAAGRDTVADKINGCQVLIIASEKAPKAGNLARRSAEQDSPSLTKVRLHVGKTSSGVTLDIFRVEKRVKLTNTRRTTMRHSKRIPLALISGTVCDPARGNVLTCNGTENSARGGLRDIVPTSSGKERSDGIGAYPPVEAARPRARAATDTEIAVNYRKNKPVLAFNHGDCAFRATSGTRPTSAAMRRRLKQCGNFAPFHVRHAVIPLFASRKELAQNIGVHINGKSQRNCQADDRAQNARTVGGQIIKNEHADN